MLFNASMQKHACSVSRTMSMFWWPHLCRVGSFCNPTNFVLRVLQHYFETGSTGFTEPPRERMAKKRLKDLHPRRWQNPIFDVQYHSCLLPFPPTPTLHKLKLSPISSAGTDTEVCKKTDRWCNDFCAGHKPVTKVPDNNCRMIWRRFLKKPICPV